MTTVTIEIDGKPLEAHQGQMVIEVADKAGIPIPRFCYHKKLSIAANCRMCLVDVANSPKPLPACATPVSEGMKVNTASHKAKEAQKAVMEFLLINHPLDCPICDQGGQCELQDVALEYGRDNSQYKEGKRTVKDKNLGPLISTEMTRCIHCTRCVRFGTEIAGVREMGATGRGEFMQIGTYIENSVDSELSGNIIDLCPVGALTSKPFRFKARAWEMKAFPSISAHDCVGSNLYLHTLRNKVMRTLPREKDTLNEVWLSDRDRFSYEALNHSDRLQKPMVKQNGQWKEVDWNTALEYTVEKLQGILNTQGPSQLGAILSPNCTVEESYLLQKLWRALGSNNIDFRLRQTDTRHQTYLGAYPHFGVSLEELEHQEVVILIGSNIQKEQPIIAHRIRKASLQGSKVISLSPASFDFHFTCQSLVDVNLIPLLKRVLKALMTIHPHAGVQLPKTIQDALVDIEVSESLLSMAKDIINRKVSVILGQYASMHPNASEIFALSRWIAHLSDATWGEMSDGANSAGASLAGALPHRLPMGENLSEPGLSASQMWENPRRGYLLMNCEPEYDSHKPQAATRALQQADVVVALTVYQSKQMRDYADVMLPITPYSEMSGTFVNAWGEWQGFQAAVLPLEESRPAWKVLRVLGNMINVCGFGYETVGKVLEEVLSIRKTQPHFADNLISMPYHASSALSRDDNQFIRLAPVPLYAVDGITRRASSLQATKDAQMAIVKLHPEDAKRLGLHEGDSVWVVQNEMKSLEPLPITISDTIPLGAVWVASGIDETRTLGEPFGLVELMPA